MMRKTIALPVLVIAFALSAIVNGHVGEVGRKFIYLPQNMNNPFYTTIADTFKQVYATEGSEFSALDPNNDQAVQISMMEDAVTKGVNAIFLTPVNSAGITSGLLHAQAAGVPVIAIDSSMEEEDLDLIVSSVASDNHFAGVLTAKAMLKDFPNGAEIAIIDSPIAIACVQRVEGFFEGLGDKKGLFKVVSQQNGRAALEPSMAIAENVLQANPGIQAFFCINDPSALGVVAVLRAANRLGEVKVYGVDGSPDAKVAIKEGTIQSSAAQSPVNMAKMTKEVADKVLAGQKVEKEVLIPTFIIDASNVDQYGVSGWQ